MTDIEIKRSLIQAMLECEIINITSAINPDIPSAEVKQILDDWLIKEDGDIVLDQLITLIMH